MDRFDLFIKEKQALGNSFLNDFQVQKSNQEVESHVLRLVKGDSKVQVFGQAVL